MCVVSKFNGMNLSTIIGNTASFGPSKCCLGTKPSYGFGFRDATTCGHNGNLAGKRLKNVT